jgi:class 3 adenylate cyclase
MARLDRLVRTTVDGYGGYLFASGGESFGVAFHRADDAAACATQLQVAVGKHQWPGGVDVRVRIGLHTGETEERATGYFGPAVHVAARIAAAGHGGQILASAVTGSLLDRADLRDLGSIRTMASRRSASSKSTKVSIPRSGWQATVQATSHTAWVVSSAARRSSRPLASRLTGARS